MRLLETTQTVTSIYLRRTLTSWGIQNTKLNCYIHFLTQKIILIMDVNYIVRTHREGTIDSTPSIEATLNKMGKANLDTRLLGSVVAIVEKVDGRITKQKLRWGSDNDPKFNSSMNELATVLLADTVKASEGGGDTNDLRVKYVGKK
jgi:hypothetical protein